MVSYDSQYRLHFSGSSSEPPPEYVTALEQYYGGPRYTGVFFQVLSPGTDLETFARQAFRHFLGSRLEEEGREEQLFSEWEEMWRRQFPSKTSIIEDLREYGPDLQVEQLLDNRDDAEAAQTAIIRAFDHPSTIDLRVYYLGDADILSGVLIAGLRENLEATVVLLFMD